MLKSVPNVSFQRASVNDNRYREAERLALAAAYRATGEIASNNGRKQNTDDFEFDDDTEMPLPPPWD